MSVLSHLGFRRKMLLLPATAVVAFVVVLGVNEALGVSAQSTLRRLEHDFVPALEASRDLEEVVADLQRALADAVAAEDTEAVAEAGQLRTRFRERTAALQYDPQRRDEAERLAAEFDALYAVAREAALRMMKGTATNDILLEASRRFAALRKELSACTRHEREVVADGFAQAARIRRATALAGGLGTGAAVIALAFLARWVVRGVVEPVVALSRAAKRVAQGDLAHPPVAVVSNDELGELAHSFGVMVERLRTLPASLSEAVDELGRAVAEVETAARKQGTTLERQMAALTRSRSTAERILRESYETSRRAEMVLKITGQVEAFGDAAQLAARESVTGLGEISEHVKQVTGGVAQLARHTQVIGELVATMKRFATESSELALSVSVEAARAGAVGGPLAEAARLLKDLATRSTQTSARVTRVLADAEAAVAGVSTLSEESKRRMGRGVDQVRSSGDSLREITAIVQKSGKAARAIVSSVSEQGHAITEITTDVLALDRAMAEALKGSRRAQSSAEALKRTAGRLTGLVQSFKV